MICVSDLLGYLRVLDDKSEQLETGKADAEDGSVGVEGSMHIRGGSLEGCSRCDQATIIFRPMNSSSF